MWADWINFAITFLLIFGSLFLAARLLLMLLMRLAQKTASEYDEVYLRSIRQQIDILVLVISLDIATTRLLSILNPVKQSLTQLCTALIVLIIAIISWKLIDLLVLWYQDLAKKIGKSDHQEAALQLAQRAGRILVIIVSTLLILSNFGINVSALLATLGIGGLALSLAAQETLSNMISGIMILMDQPFRIGDRIEIQGLNTWGDVVDIGLRSTRIRTRDNRMVIVPNSTISKSQVINYTFPDPRYRVQVDIEVIYGSDPRIVREIITQAIRGLEGVLADRPVDVLFMGFNQSKMNFRVRWWIESYSDSRQDFDQVNEVIYQALKEAKMDMPASTTPLSASN